MLNTQFSPWPSYSEEEAEAAKNVILSNQVNYWTGELCKRFEFEFAKMVGVDYAISVSNGTVALELALRALGVQAGDEVIVPSRTFVADASVVASIGATPIFTDVELDSGNICHKSIEKNITSNTKAIICVHLAGWPCAMEEIMALAEKHNLFVVEDCAQAHGAMLNGQPVGSFGHVSCWSFCQDKIITTGGEGGMVVTNCDSLFQFMWSYKDHGKDYNLINNTPSEIPGFKWLHSSLGSNFRMTEVQAAIGLLQLKKLDKWIERRNHIAAKLRSTFSQFDFLDCPEYPNNILHAQYKLYTYVNLDKAPQDVTRSSILLEMLSHGIPCFEGACSEVYLEKVFESSQIVPVNRLPNAKKLGDISLMFLVHPSLTDEEVGYMCETIKSVLRKVSNLK